MLKRTIAPLIENAVHFDFHLPYCHQTVLDNKLPLYWLSAGVQEVVQVEWVFRAGLWEEEKPAVAFATAGLLKNGTKNKTAKEIDEALEFYGASLKSSANNDYSSLRLRCLKKHLDKLVPMVRDIVVEADFPQKELSIYKRNILRRLSVSLKKVDFVADREADALVFGYNHPYGRFSKPEDVEQLTVADLKKFHKNYYTKENCTIFMTGKVDEEAVKIIRASFGKTDWGKTTSVASKHHLLQPAMDKKQNLKIEAESVQGAIRIVRKFPTKEHPDFAPMTILNILLGGYFGSRLMTNIREDKGYTYGIYSMIYSYRKESVFTMATEAGKEVCTAVVDEIWKELKRLREEPVSNAELSLVKNYLFGNLLGQLDGPFMIMRRWQNLILNGFDKSHFYKNLDLYKTTTPQQLQALANKYLQEKDFYSLLVV